VPHTLYCHISETRISEIQKERENNRHHSFAKKLVKFNFITKKKIHLP